MRTAIISFNDISGGAARAAYCLHRGLLDAGVETRMFVLRKESDDDTVIAPKNSFFISKIRSRLDSMPLKKYKNRDKIPFSVNWLPFSPIVKKVKHFNPDIVHLHWVGGGTLRLNDFLKFKKPIVWSLHDMYAFTGGCHYANNCDRYRKECGVCPLLASNKIRDLSFYLIRRKNKIFSKINSLTIVGLSRWISNCAKNSSLVSSFNQVVNIPNPIDVNMFMPLDKEIAKKILNLPRNNKLVVFGAVNVTSDIRKGFKELNKAMQLMRMDGITLIIFGATRPLNPPYFGFSDYYIGKLSDNLSLKILYSAADVCVVPSLQENLSNVIMESLACGTPVVAFNIGGNVDLIDHKKNGYLAEPYSPGDLSNGIKWVLNHSNPLLLKERAREKVVKNFESTLVVDQYINLYHQILSDK